MAKGDASVSEPRDIVDESGEGDEEDEGEALDPTVPVPLRRRRRRLSLAALTDLPNLLTLGRIAVIPLILYFIDNYSPVRSYIACLLYIGAALTDFLDGWLARRRRQVSLLGKFLDPLADKLIVTATLVWLSALGRCPAWLTVALLARELVVTGLRAIASSEGLVISASQEGKQKTALQMTGTLFLLIHFRYSVLGLPSVKIDYHAVGLYTLYLALAMSLLSAVGYWMRFAKALKQQREA
jgi:CDP-diacylglycerol--glycerol-3-phosphate 3-phosphatidyltransferase